MSRKGGGLDKPHKKIKILVGNKPELPALSIQCFERRHTECDGDIFLNKDEKCECHCHYPIIPPPSNEESE